MSFDRIADFSIDASVNTNVKGVNLAEGMQRNLINNCVRSLAALVKADTSAATATITASSTFTLSSISTGDYVLVAAPAGGSITSFGIGVQGQFKWLKFLGTTILRNSANLSVQGAADITLVAGDLVYVRCASVSTFDTVIFKASGLPTVDQTQGKHLIPVPARGMQPMSLSGAALTILETTTNKYNFATLNFDNSATEYAYFELVMPKSYNGGTITFGTRSESTSGVGGVKWALDAAGVSNGDTNDPAWGTAQTVTVSHSAANQLAISAESSALTISGVAAQDTVQFRIYRSPQDAADTLAADARLRGVDIFLTTNAGNDA